ncbi:MAG TPA: type I DNA topoisomerase [Longimicrobiales bacterium]|nr:type I DNA topoisomerase [Longimicrobiales bacterium]
MAKEATRLVVVESPAKARTIERYLGGGYEVKASVGHVRDLPPRELGVDVDEGFEPRYVTIRGKGRVIQDLKRSAQHADEVILATDPDREGEAIAYHVAELLGWRGDGDARFRRARIFEITKDAVSRALDQSGELDMRKVDAQQARRILDRLVGYQVSPLLWKPIRPGLSAGRVQTVALRLLTEREKEIRAFVAEEYWSITAQLAAHGEGFEAKLHQIDGESFRIPDEAGARAALAAIDGVPFDVAEIRRRERRKNPPPPFTTSTLQQEAAKRLGFPAQKTMRTAQSLYEGVEVGTEGAVGLITYMRTDSTRVSTAAADAARGWVKGSFGDEYLPGSRRVWGGKQQKGAQEAHEAIRPTDPTRHPDQVRRHLNKDQARLYELIWLRFVAAQIQPAVFDTTSVDFPLRGADGATYLFRANGSVMKFDGFTRLYREAREDGDKQALDDLDPLPALAEGERCDLRELVPAQHFTQPPPRFSEASLVKELEKLGIGRPSTYASILSTIRDRGYAEMEKKRFKPTPLGETVADVLVELFPRLFAVDFTNRMEAELDRIEEGELDWRGVLGDFYGPFAESLQDGEQRADDVVREVVAGETQPCEVCGRDMVVRWNRFGRFLGCSGYPECTHTESLDGERAEPQPTGEACPECGGDLVERQGRMGAFIGCSNYPQCRYTKPRTIPGLTCPECGEGEVAEKRTRRGKPFWGCVRYPECDWSTWDRPVPGPCPVCGRAFVTEKTTKAKGTFIRCPECKAEMEPGQFEAERAEAASAAE